MPQSFSLRWIPRWETKRIENTNKYQLYFFFVFYVKQESIFATFREISLKQFSRIVEHPICYISLAAFAVSTNGSTVIELTQICNKYNLTPRHSFLFLHVLLLLKTVYNFPESSSSWINRTAFNCHWIIFRTYWWSVLPNIHIKSEKPISFKPTSSALLVRKEAHMVILGPQYLNNNECWCTMSSPCSIYQKSNTGLWLSGQNILCLVIPGRDFKTKKAKWNQI